MATNDNEVLTVPTRTTNINAMHFCYFVLLSLPTHFEAAVAATIPLYSEYSRYMMEASEWSDAVLKGHKS